MWLKVMLPQEMIIFLSIVQAEGGQEIHTNGQRTEYFCQEKNCLVTYVLCASSTPMPESIAGPHANQPS